jgi:AraC-like DNA-binding protein
VPLGKRSLGRWPDTAVARAYDEKITRPADGRRCPAILVSDHAGDADAEPPAGLLSFEAISMRAVRQSTAGTAEKPCPELPVSWATEAWRPLPLQVADITCLSRSGYTVSPHAFEWLGVTLVLSSVVVQRESRTLVAAAAGTILVVPAGEVVAMRTAGPGPCRLKTLLLGDAHLSALDHPLQPALIRDTALTSDLASLFRELELPMRSIDVARRVQALVERVAARHTPAEPAPMQLATPLTPVRDYLRSHLTGATAVAELEHFSGLTRFHLARVFHREFGLAPRAYQLRQRLARASRLLALGTASSDASYRCGFADQSHLTRAFREAYGITPYRWSTTFLAERHPHAVEARSPLGRGASRQDHPIGLCPSARTSYSSEG